MAKTFCAAFGAAFKNTSVPFSEGQEAALINMRFAVLHRENLIILCKWWHLLFVMLHKVMKMSLQAYYYVRHIFASMD